MCFYALRQLSNHIKMHKKVIFRWLCFPQVVQKQTLSEVENWMVISWQVVSGIFLPKIIKIWQLVFKLQSKMSRMFFETQCSNSSSRVVQRINSYMVCYHTHI